MPDIFTLVTPDRFWMFLASGLLLNLTPGADVMFATASGLRSGPRVGAAAGLGVGLGGIWHIGLAALGITALLAAVPAALVALKWLGAAYLLWLAWNSWNAGAASATEGGMTAAAAIRRGFLTNALNPKTTLFVVALFTQVISPDTATLTQLGYGLFMAVAHLFWFALVAYGLSSEAARGFVARSRHLIERAIGGVLFALGLGLAASSLQRS